MHSTAIAIQIPASLIHFLAIQQHPPLIEELLLRGCLRTREECVCVCLFGCVQVEERSSPFELWKLNPFL